MTKETIEVAGRCCSIYTADGSKYLLIQPVDEHDQNILDNEVAVIMSQAEHPFSLIAFEVRDWQSELAPWAAPAVFGKIPFGNGAVNTLSFIKDLLMPELQRKQIYDSRSMKCLLGGYSLAGLFSLWSCYQTNLFHGIAAVSPSVWYPCWMEYAESHKPLAAHIYLSLGDKEEKARNQVMARVGECIRKQHELLNTHSFNTILEWNKGNHFQHTDERTARGFAWLINQIQ